MNDLSGGYVGASGCSHSAAAPADSPDRRQNRREVNELTLKPKIPSFRRLIPLTAALLLARC